MRSSLYIPTFITVFAACTCQLGAQNQTRQDKSKQVQASPQDQISVSGHIAISGGPVLKFIATQHYDRRYVYAERGSGQPVTLLDITKPGQPLIVSQLDASSGAVNLISAAGTAVLSTTAPDEIAKPPVQTIRLMDLSDPANPKVTQQFDGVTAVGKLSGGLILLANPEGVWVLSQRLAEDPKEEERYARQVIYGDSMY